MRYLIVLFVGDDEQNWDSVKEYDTELETPNDILALKDYDWDKAEIVKVQDDEPFREIGKTTFYYSSRKKFEENIKFISDGMSA